MRGKLAMGGLILGAAWGAYRRLSRLTSLECSYADAPTKMGVQGSMFSGLMPAMVTPFDERGEVDLRATEAVIERLIEAGVSGTPPGKHWRVLAPPRR